MLIQSPKWQLQRSFLSFLLIIALISVIIMSSVIPSHAAGGAALLAAFTESSVSVVAAHPVAACILVTLAIGAGVGAASDWSALESMAKSMLDRVPESLLTVLDGLSDIVLSGSFSISSLIASGATEVLTFLSDWIASSVPASDIPFSFSSKFHGSDNIYTGTSTSYKYYWWNLSDWGLEPYFENFNSYYSSSSLFSRESKIFVGTDLQHILDITFHPTGDALSWDADNFVLDFSSLSSTRFKYYNPLVWECVPYGDTYMFTLYAQKLGAVILTGTLQVSGGSNLDDDLCRERYFNFLSGFSLNSCQSQTTYFPTSDTGQALTEDQPLTIPQDVQSAVGATAPDVRVGEIVVDPPIAGDSSGTITGQGGGTGVFEGVGNWILNIPILGDILAALQSIISQLQQLLSTDLPEQLQSQIEAFRDALVDKLALNQFTQSFSAFQQMQTGYGTAPKITLNLHALANVAQQVGSFSNSFPDEESVVIDFSFLEDERFKFMDLTLIDLIRALGSLAMVMSTALYCYKKITSGDVIG